MNETSYIYVNSNVTNGGNLTVNADHTFNTRTQNIKNDHPNVVNITILSLNVENNVNTDGVILRLNSGALNSYSVDNKAPCLSVCVNKSHINAVYVFSSLGEQSTLKISSDALTNMSFHFEDMTGSIISLANLNFAFVIKVESTQPSNAMAIS